ncbi:Bgt-50325 [Blumeria graminis f. sp. tritici]|uniref:Bgt-50325 n=1 Tax=Blumeria graminis f. sp. tritici TaxID=62690 RepID=A0A9X9ME90_BLUGR|nr:Bgt-50325 [Blumeria graminis f. sp. tritici]
MVTKAHLANGVAIESFIFNLCRYGVKYRNIDDFPLISYFIIPTRLLNGITYHSIFNHLIYAIEYDYEETFIIQTCVNLCEIISSFQLSPVPFQRVPSSPINSLNPVPRVVPECYKYCVADPTRTIETELRNKTYIKVSVFWERFFEEKSWSDQTKRIWESYKDYKKNADPKYCRLNLAEQGIWDWLASFNNLFLSRISESSWLPSEHFPNLEKKDNDLPLRGKICLLTTVGGWRKDEAQGQLDFQIKSIDPLPGEDDWKTVRVVGGLSTKLAKGRRKIKFIELVTYVREIFWAQPIRRFVHGFCLFKKKSNSG